MSSRYFLSPVISQATYCSRLPPPPAALRTAEAPQLSCIPSTLTRSSFSEAIGLILSFSAGTRAPPTVTESCLLAFSTDDRIGCRYFLSPVQRYDAQNSCIG